MEYQVRASETATVYQDACEKASNLDPEPSNQILRMQYVTMGLCGEAGEFANKAKKILRDTNGEYTAEVQSAISKELGGVLWYWAQCCTEFGLNAGAVAQENLRVLQDRDSRDVIKGSGDDR